ncbi:type IV pilus biogenesis protein PilP [Trinickia terrae]|uniref:Type IV pilus biogenesis protein PilP n=1 Tax=Trinickia terrae TaxID=2571161 RepID=A0A4U1I9H8_9BURK|nr:type IV pilus biogenesis protein PilP [Trinickia terrae]TKC90132.1 type IV pilus biogenesis protein PilP [Trinickia terrae]
MKIRFSMGRVRAAACAVAALSMSAGAAFAATAAGIDTASSAPAVASGASAYQAPTWSTYYGSVDAIRADTQKAQAELENLQIHHQLDEARRGNFQQNGGAAAPSTPAIPALTVGQQPAPAARDPLVQQVSMVDGRWTAVIQLSSGARVTVHQGESVRGLGKIASIALGQVMVSQGDKVTALQFAGDGAQDAAPQTNPSLARPMAGPMSMPMGMH